VSKNRQRKHAPKIYCPDYHIYKHWGGDPAANAFKSFVACRGANEKEEDSQEILIENNPANTPKRKQVWKPKTEVVGFGETNPLCQRNKNKPPLYVL
jgi:hypothetical protein